MSPTSSSQTASPLRVAVALGTVYVIWGSTYLAIAVAVKTLPPFWMAGARFVISGALLYGLAMWQGAARPTLAKWRSAALIGAMLLFIGTGGVAWAEQRVSSGVAALLVSMTPLWMVLFRWLQPGGERPSGRVWAGLALGFAGLMILARPWEAISGGGLDPLGVGALLLSCVTWAWGSIWSRRVSLPESPLMATGLEMLCGGAMLLLFGAFAGEPAQLHLAAVSLGSVLALVYLITFGSVGFIAYIWLLRAANPVLVSTYAYVNPMVAVFLGWLILSEPVTGKTLAGAAVIVAAVALITSAQRRPEEKPKPVAESRKSECPEVAELVEA